MTTRNESSLFVRIARGAAAGIAGGAVFGLMMIQMGTLPMIGRMIGAPNAVAGFVVHLAISATIGAGYGLLLGRLRGKVAHAAAGTAYGGVWWLLGPLTLMPLFMGMGLGVNWNAGAAQAMLPSLWGHLIFGLVAGLAFPHTGRLLPAARPDAAEEAEPRRAA